MKASRLRTIKQVATELPAISERTLRHWIFFSGENGFASVVVRVGGRVYLDIEALDAWLAEQAAA